MASIWLMAQTSTDKEAIANGTRPKRERTKKVVSIQDDGAAQSDLSLLAQVDQNPVEWSALSTFSAFTTNPSSRLIKVKDSRTSYIDLKTGDHVLNVVSGRCYRVHI